LFESFGECLSQSHRLIGGSIALTVQSLKRCQRAEFARCPAVKSVSIGQRGHAVNTRALRAWKSRLTGLVSAAQLRILRRHILCERRTETFSEIGRLGKVAMRFSSIPFFGAAGFVAAAVFLAGCERKGSPGGPGVTTTATGSSTTTSSAATTTTVAKPSQTFKVTLPSGNTSVKQGESKTVTISLDRDSDFDQTVSLKFSGQPAGVRFEPAGNQVG
jgi:hypothetical protein